MLSENSCIYLILSYKLVVIAVSTSKFWQGRTKMATCMIPFLWAVNDFFKNVHAKLNPKKKSDLKTVTANKYLAMVKLSKSEKNCKYKYIVKFSEGDIT